MKRESEVIGKMKSFKLSEKFRQIVLTAMIVTAAVMILFAKQFAMTVLASTGKVTSTTANVRSAASTTSDAIASLSKGDTVDIKSQTNGTDGYVWYQIQVNATTTGYIRSDLVEITDGTTPATSGDTTTTTTTTTTTATPTVNTDGITVVETISGTTTAEVNVRADASTNAEIVAKATNGLTLSVSGTKQGTDGNTWYYLTFNKDGASVTGYIRSDYVNLSGDLREPSSEAEPDPVQTTTETVQTTVQKHWDTQEQADGWFLLDYEQGKQYNIDNMFEKEEANAAQIEELKGKVKSLRTGLIIVVIILVVVVAGAVFFFMKWKDLDDRAAFAEAERERAKRIAGHGEGRRPQSQAGDRQARPAREGARREQPAGERRRPDGGARPQGDRPVRSANPERRPADVSKGQSSHTVRPSEPAEKAAAEPAQEVREERTAPEAAEAVEKKPHRTRPAADSAPKEHHRKAPIVDDDDDEFEFGFLNWDDDDK